MTAARGRTADQADAARSRRRREDNEPLKPLCSIDKWQVSPGRNTCPAGGYLGQPPALCGMIFGPAWAGGGGIADLGDEGVVFSMGSGDRPPHSGLSWTAVKRGSYLEK
jgi:hypothetical protein